MGDEFFRNRIFYLAQLTIQKLDFEVLPKSVPLKDYLNFNSTTTGK